MLKKQIINCVLSAVSVHSKDVRLPIQLQRAMAAEAEATREAKAKVKYSCHVQDSSII
jgi:hypothetical protein